MKQKKFTTTKILVSIPWILSFIILYFVIYAIINEKGLTAVATLGTMYGATISVGAFGLKYYTKKSSLENVYCPTSDDLKICNFDKSLRSMITV